MGKDLASLNITEAQVVGHNKVDLKKLLKLNATNTAFKELKEIQAKHTKEKHVVYDTLEMQLYLRSDSLSSEEKHTLTAIRSQSIKNVRNNFKKMFKN